MSSNPLNPSEIELARKVNAKTVEDFYKKLALTEGWQLEKDDVSNITPLDWSNQSVS